LFWLACIEYCLTASDEIVGFILAAYLSSGTWGDIGYFCKLGLISVVLDE
jgi:hypothetical protein